MVYLTPTQRGKIKLGSIQKDLFDLFKMRNLILEECILKIINKIILYLNCDCEKLAYNKKNANLLDQF